jgi:hypothetical protein
VTATGYQSADLLTRFNQFTGRPASGDTITDTTKYQYLADAQAELIGEMVSLAPRPFITGPVDITANTTDNKVFTFGNDADGYPLFALATRIYTSLNAIPGYPLIPGADYLDEGTQIRIPNNMLNPYAAIIWYGVAYPQRMSATVQPSLQPPAARLLIPYRAAATFAMSAGVRNPALAQFLTAKCDLEFGKWMTTIRRHFKGGGALAPLVTPFGTGQVFSGSQPW